MQYKDTYAGKKPYEVEGVVLSFDFVINNLKIYYSNKSPQGAYAVIERFLKKNGFEKWKDSDYVHDTLDWDATMDIIADFSEENPWFPFCIGKVIISPNIPRLDVTQDIESLYGDKTWKKEKENLTANKSAENSKGKDIMDFVNSHKADKIEINNKNPQRSTSNDRERQPKYSNKEKGGKYARLQFQSSSKVQSRCA